MYPHIDEHDGHRSCQKCHILCANCTGPGSGNCTSCNENGREENGKCQPICGKQYVIIILSLNELCAKIIVMLCWLSSTVHVAKRFFNGLLKRSNCVALDASGTFSMIFNAIYVSQNHLAWFCCKIDQTCISYSRRNACVRIYQNFWGIYQPKPVGVLAINPWMVDSSIQIMASRKLYQTYYYFAVNIWTWMRSRKMIQSLEKIFY